MTQQRFRHGRARVIGRMKCQLGTDRAIKQNCTAVKRLGGAEGDRTPDLLIANEALSQLSYGPKRVTELRRHRHLRVPPFR